MFEEDYERQRKQNEQETENFQTFNGAVEDIYSQLKRIANDF